MHEVIERYSKNAVGFKYYTEDDIKQEILIEIEKSRRKGYFPEVNNKSYVAAICRHTIGDLRKLEKTKNQHVFIRDPKELETSYTPNIEFALEYKLIYERLPKNMRMLFKDLHYYTRKDLQKKYNRSQPAIFLRCEQLKKKLKRMYSNY